MNWDSWKYPSHFKGLGLTNKQIASCVMGTAAARGFLHSGQKAKRLDDSVIASSIAGSRLDVDTLVERIAQALELDAAQTAAVLTRFATVEWLTRRAEEVRRWA